MYVSVPHTYQAADEVAEQQDYKMDEPPFHENMHTDLKRGLERGLKRRQERTGDDFQRDLPLFEKYQFLTPGESGAMSQNVFSANLSMFLGIFMGLTVSIMLFGILYVGVSAIAGLEVSYMAFSKEMGPQAQKKQQ